MAPSDAGGQAGEAHEPTERLAPVTYLFGGTLAERAAVAEQVDPEQSVPEQSVSEESVPEGPIGVSASHPVFRDEAAVTAVRSDDRSQRASGSFERVSNVSMYALARRGMSSQEMRDYLLGREFDEATVDDEVARLERVGLLDDDSLAETLVRTLRDRKGLGRSALTAELRRRNVGGAAIEEAISGLDDDELERATAIAIKRAPQLRALDSVTAKRRLGAFLMRKGYSGSVISTAVQRALAPSGPSFR